SFKAWAGTIAETGADEGVERTAFRTESLNPSAAAIVSLSLSTCTSTPINTGRASSEEAAKATWWIISRKSPTLICTAPSKSGTGKGGNSWASIHLISFVEVPPRTFNVCVDVSSFNNTWSPGNVLTTSENVRAGTVVEP